MSKKYVLIPLKTFTDLCSSVKRNGDSIVGIVKTLTEDEPKKRPRKTKYLFRLKVDHHLIFI